MKNMCYFMSQKQVENDEELFCGVFLVCLF